MNVRPPEPPDRPEPPDVERAENLRAASLLRNLPAVPPGAVVRIRRRLTGEVPDAPGAPRHRLLAAAALLLGLGAVGAWRALPSVDPPLTGLLQSDTDWGEGSPRPGVQLSWLGAGEVEGPPEAPELRWDQGTLNVEVVPDQGIQLTVRTREARVRVVGTGFSVTRDGLGTRVHVRHGRVEVGCADAEPVVLSAGGEHACLPISAAGLLGRARALGAAGAPAADILATLDRGLALQATGPVADELSVARIRALLDAGRRDEALGAADGYLAAGGLRADEVAVLRDEAGP